MNSQMWSSYRLPILCLITRLQCPRSKNIRSHQVESKSSSILRCFETNIYADRLTDFLITSRAAYNEQIPYHNFRHVVDVLQAVFVMLVQLGALPPYPGSIIPSESLNKTGVASLIRPADALCLMIAAIGHDVGHPGVNNAFLVKLKAPLAQLYNDKSVLESFHCAAFSQVLRRHWPEALDLDLRKLMIDTILATDMGLHFDYMAKLESLKQQVQASGGVENWDEKTTAANRTIVCSILIKCADISNVVSINGT